MKVSIVKANNAVTVYLTVKEKTLEAIKTVGSFELKDKEGKVEYTLNYGAPEVKNYGVSINSTSSLVETVLISDESLTEPTVKCLKIKFGKIKSTLEKAETELVKYYNKIVADAEEIEVTTVGEEE